MNQQRAETLSADRATSTMEVACKDEDVAVKPRELPREEASVREEGEAGSSPTSLGANPPDKNVDLGVARQRIRRLSKVNHDAEMLRQSFFVEPAAESGGYSSTEQHHELPRTNREGNINLQKPVAVRPVAVRPVAVRPSPIRPTPIRPLVGQPHQRQEPLTQQQRILPTTSSKSMYPNHIWANAPQPNGMTNGRRAMKSVESLARKYKKPSWYHSVAAQNRLGSIHEDAFLPESDDEAGSEGTSVDDQVTSPMEEPVSGQYHHDHHQQRIQAKQALLRALNSTGGDANTPAFHLALQKLLLRYDPSHFDPRRPVLRYAQTVAANQLEGIGIAAGKPTFPGCVGRNDDGDPMYKLGTMSFDMFCPTQLVVSVQGTFVLIDTVDGRNAQGVKHVPKNLQDDVRFGKSPVRTYDIVTPFTIEPWQPDFGAASPNKGVEQPIQGVMTTYGFLLPYPTKHRFAVWFTGGSLEVDGNKNEKWFQIFDKEAAPKRTAAECGKLLAAKLLMGASTNNGEMDKDGKLSYSLSRPKASHVDLLYLDKTLQVLRASSGTVYVHVRLPGSKAVHASVLSDEPLPAPMDPFLHIENQINYDDSAVAVDNDFDYTAQQSMDHGNGCGDMDKPNHDFNGTGSFPLRKTVSESDLYDPFSQEQGSTSDARLQELEAYAVVEQSTSQTKPCLKKVSSYGDLEEVGTNIPMNADRKAWMVLPEPTRKCDVPRNVIKKQPKRSWARLKYTLSDPNLFSLWSDTSHHSKSDNDTLDTNSVDSDDSAKNLIAPKHAPKLTKAVSFSCLEIRSYNLCVGDNPACSHGVPVSLDWTYEPRSTTLPVPADEREKGGQDSKHRVHAMNASERRRKLCDEFGAGMSDIRRALGEVQRVKHERKKSLRSASNPSAMKVEVALESVQRKAQRAVNRLMPRRKYRSNSSK